MSRRNMIVLMVLTLLSSIPTASSAGSWNGWIYQNPYPTSNHLYAVKFVTPKKGWIAGEQGAILYTEDGGGAWEYQESGTEKTIKSLFFVNERQGWAVGGEDRSREKGVIIHTEDGGKTWIQQQGDFNSPLNRVFFLNEKEGWIAGNQGILLHTIDAGKKWERQRSLGVMRAIASVYFINSRTGWLLAGDEIYRTTDGGKNWDKTWLNITLPRGGGLAMDITGASMPPEWNQGEIYFINEKKGWAVTGFWHIFSTEDGGKTWTNQFPVKTMSYDLRHISFSDDKRGCAAGSSIICTEDGGKTWNERLGVRPGGHERINDFLIELSGISLVNQSIGWAVGNDGQIMKTEDGGKTWSMAARNTGCGGNAFFINKKTGWLHGYGTPYICRTDDGGHTWEKQDAGFDVWSVFFVNETKGWAVGTIKEGTGQATKVWGVMKHSNDGGKTWKTQFKEFMDDEIAGLYNVSFLNAQIGWVVGKKGTILHTEDGGEHWEHQKSGDPELQLMAVQFIDLKTGWITGIRSTEVWSGVVLHTTDGGRHWKSQYSKKGFGLENAFFTDKKNGWVTGETEWGGVSSLFRTSDGGKTWKEAGLGRIGTIHPAFRGNHGALITDKGWLAITTDGGTSWKKARKLSSKYPWYFLELFEKGK